MVRVAWAGRVMTITLDRPERRNAVDLATLSGLGEAIDEAAAGGPDERARAIVLTGAPPAFSAGADLGGVEESEFAEALADVLRRLAALPIPVIAAIDGPALGAGAQLVSVCDLRVATPASRIGIPAARLGLVVDQWTVQRLVREFTGPIARAMLLVAETCDAERLYAAGVVHRLGDLAAAQQWAADISELAPLAVAGHKLAIEQTAFDPGVVELVDAAREAAWSSADAAEGRAAFLEKRPAVFTGR